MKDFIDREIAPHPEASDDGVIIFEFTAKTGVLYFIVADFKHEDEKGDRRDVFYHKDCPRCPLLYYMLIRFLCSEELYSGFSFDEARKAMG